MNRVCPRPGSAGASARQIDYADEPPAIRKPVAEALTKHDLKPRMEEAYRAELAETTTKAA